MKPLVKKYMFPDFTDVSKLMPIEVFKGSENEICACLLPIRSRICSAVSWSLQKTLKPSKIKPRTHKQDDDAISVAQLINDSQQKPIPSRLHPIMFLAFEGFAMNFSNVSFLEDVLFTMICLFLRRDDMNAFTPILNCFQGALENHFKSSRKTLERDTDNSVGIASHGTPKNLASKKRNRHACHGLYPMAFIS